MNKILLLVGAGGFLGSVARYLSTLYFLKHFSPSFPYGTFVVNVTGCLVVGILFGLSGRFNIPNAEWRMFFIVGFCGGFTTFSAFAYENVMLLQQAKYIAFATYSIGSFVSGLIAVVAGLAVSRMWE